MIQSGQWYRTCQECGHQQAAKQPAAGKGLQARTPDGFRKYIDWK